MEKGIQHEADCLAEYRKRGLDVFEVPSRRRGEPFADWVDRVGNPFDSGHDVIYQMPFLHDGVRGIADFLVRVDDPESGTCAYEPVDAKLARSEGKPGHVLQLCFYADALEAMTGLPPKRIHLWLGSGKTESLLAEEFQPYWRRLRAQLASVLDDSSEDADTVPEPCGYCEFCEFQETCTNEWRDQRFAHLCGQASGVPTDPVWKLPGSRRWPNSPSAGSPSTSIPSERLGRLVEQAALQARARADEQTAAPLRDHRTVRGPHLGTRLRAHARARRG